MFTLYHYYSITVTYSSPSSSFLNPRRSMFSFWNTSRSKFVANKEALLGLRTSPPTLNRRSTAAELGMGVLYLVNTSIHACLCSLRNRTWLSGVLFFAHCHSYKSWRGPHPAPPYFRERHLQEAPGNLCP